MDKGGASDTEPSSTTAGIGTLARANRELVAALNDAGVDFVVLRDPPGSASPELDLLLAERHEQRALDALRELGHVLPAGAERRAGKRHAYRPLPDGTIHVADLHFALVQDGLTYMDARRALADRVDREGWPRLRDEDLLVHLVLHELLAHGRIRPDRLDPIRELAALPLDASRIDEALAHGGLREPYRDRIHGRIDALAADPVACGALRRALVGRLLRGRPTERWARLRARLRWHAARLLLRPRATLVAVVGPDGAGKTTLVRLLADSLDATPGLQSTQAYLGPWGEWLVPRPLFGGNAPVPWRDLSRVEPVPAGEEPVDLRLAFRAWGKRRRSAALDPAEERALARAERHSRAWCRLRNVYDTLSAWLFLGYLVPEYLVRFLRVRRERSRGRIVVADRYVDDLRTGSMHAVVDRFRGLRSLLLRACPRPDLLVVLLGEPERIRERKAQLDDATLRGFLEVYESIAREPEATVLRSDAPPGALLDRLLADQLPAILRQGGR